MTFIHRLSDLFHKVEKFIAIILCLTMLISLSLGVFFRYVLSAPLNWSDETAIFSLVWLTFIGGSLGIKTQSSAAVTLFMDRFSGKIKTILFGLGLLAALVFVAYIFYLSIIWISSPSIMLQRSNSMRLPMIIPYLSVPVSFFFMTIHSIDLMAKNFLDKREAL
ncbi:TRAP transporter small permease subunit [Neobacillus sp. DY30]|uniref:TRAP transporter small permease n=1 Tax=Neobacillus sp. DY30 TaxID=3047871 RepID=UPI0024C058D8|nr:TRAP transporter small permease subunit [Neobacillus sp. DY30]WHX99906.1 TRAP transporter small permease subunit [Neobacillus sp. DY30]